MITKMKPKGICIHNTNNALSARENAELWKSMKCYPLCHFFVDENEVIQIQSTSKVAHHTGKALDPGNLYTISIEICRSTCATELYLRAEENATIFTNKLMNLFEWGMNDLYFHNDFNKHTYCPHRIFDTYKNKEEFINYYQNKGVLLLHLK